AARRNGLALSSLAARVRSVAVAVAATGALTGCGTAGSEHDARATARQFLTALDQRDGQAACDQLSEQTSSALEDAKEKPCEQAILELGLGGKGVAHTRVNLENAQVDLADGNAMFLSQYGDGWLIKAAGCEPRPDAPYDCVLED